MSDWEYASVDLHGHGAVVSMKPIIHCIINSTDQNLISSDIIVNLHPDTTIGRVLQYVYDLVQHNTTHCINEFALTYKGDLLQVTTPLSSVDSNQDLDSHKFLKLNFELYEYNDIPHDFKCDYAMDFMYGDFDIEINVLSKENDKKNNPIITLNKSRVPLHISGSRLQKLLLEDIIDLEFGKDTICHSKDQHSIEDFIAFKIKGNDDNEIVKLKDEDGKINDNFLDSPLNEILGVTFMPEKLAKFTLMFYIHHEYNYSSDEKLLEFISDIPSVYNQMVINNNTTVIDIKRYIIQTCLIHSDYDIPLHDITLLHQGQRVQDNDTVGNVTLIKDIIGDNKHPSIHVQMPSIDINRLNNEDSFWCQNHKFNKHLSDVSVNSGKSDEIRMHSPNNDESVDLIKEWEEDEDYVPSDTSSASYNHERYHDNNEEIMDDIIRYRTESGHKIKILDGLYKKCIIDDKEQAFINIKYLEPQQAKLKFQYDGSDTMEELPLDTMKQYNLRLGSNMIDLDDCVVNKLESKLNMAIVPEEVEEVEETIGMAYPPAPLLRNRLIMKVMHAFFTIGMFIFLILKTLYYVVITNFMIFMLLSEIAFFVSLKTTSIVLCLVIARTIFVNEEVRNSWIDFFHLDRYSVKNLERIKKFVEDDNLAIDFYDRIACTAPNTNNKSILNKLFKYPEFHNIFINIIDSNGLGDSSLDLMEQMGVDPNITVIEKERLLKAWKELILFYILVLMDVDRHDEILNKKQFIQDMTELLGNIEKEMYKNKRLPLKLRLINEIQNGVRRVRNINLGRQILEYIVPNPLRDNILLSLLKNMILFVLLLLPLVNLEVDKIVKERKEAIERQQARLREQQELQAQHDETTHASEDLQAQHDETTHASEDLQAQHDETTHASEELQAQHDETTHASEDLQAQHDETTHASEDLQAQHDETTHASEEIQAQHDETTHASEDLQAQHDETTHASDELQAQHDETTHASDELQAQHDEVVPASDELQAQHDEVVHASDELQDQQSQREELQDQPDELQDQHLQHDEGVSSSVELVHDE
ncbi:hypothetical protein MOSE0_M08218 [Monosporozyma servazzii]